MSRVRPAHDFKRKSFRLTHQTLFRVLGHRRESSLPCRVASSHPQSIMAEPKNLSIMRDVDAPCSPASNKCAPTDCLVTLTDCLVPCLSSGVCGLRAVVRRAVLDALPHGHVRVQRRLLPASHPLPGRLPKPTGELSVSVLPFGRGRPAFVLRMPLRAVCLLPLVHSLPARTVGRCLDRGPGDRPAALVW